MRAGLTPPTKIRLPLLPVFGGVWSAYYTNVPRAALLYVRCHKIGSAAYCVDGNTITQQKRGTVKQRVTVVWLTIADSNSRGEVLPTKEEGVKFAVTVNRCEHLLSTMLILLQKALVSRMPTVGLGKLFKLNSISVFFCVRTVTQKNTRD